MRCARFASASVALVFLIPACNTPPVTMGSDAGSPGDGAVGDAWMAGDGGPGTDGGPGIDGGPTCGTLSECAAAWEARASDHLDAVADDPVALAAFLHDVPKGGDLHNHLTGAVYAETYLAWGSADGDCINTTTFAAVYPGSCSASTQPAPTSGAFYEQIIDAWSMRNFVPGGAESGHDHFFATFGKYGAIAGAHRDDDIADVAARAADESQLYVETMFNVGKEVGDLAATTWSGSVTASDLPSFYAMLTASSSFGAAVTTDTATVTSASRNWRNMLDCSGDSPPAACDVEVRFVAQVSRTGANDQIFGQLVSAFEIASRTGALVGVNLSSPEDDSRAISNYDLHMAMLDFLYQTYTATSRSPLRVTLHAGELTPAFLPSGSTANTFHIRAAVEIAHAERIGHGIDVLSETDATGLLDEMRDRHVLVEVCLSSNAQILEVAGAAHPLMTYLDHDVPVALATDDQGVSRSSMAGEYARAVTDQGLDYRQLKTLARQSLEHSFLPGASLWEDVTTGTMVSACTPLADPPSTACQTLLDGSERARMQWMLESRFRAFERLQ